MRSQLVVIASMAVPLAGCAPGGQAASAPGSLVVPMRFHALGTEPFWGMTVAGRDVRYSTPEIPEDKARNVARTRSGGVESVSGRLGAVPFRLTVRPERCSDGMSDRVYPLSARLDIGHRTLQGCAAVE